MLLIALSLPLPAAGAHENEAAPDRPRRLQIELPPHVLADAPLPFLKVKAVDAQGDVAESVDGPVTISGVRIVERDHQTGREREFASVEMTDGRINLKTDLAAGRKLYVTAPTISAETEDGLTAEETVAPIAGWLSIVPPALAVLLAVLLRRVIVALFLAILSGAIILAHGDPLAGLLASFDTFLLEAAREPDHIKITLFTLFLGSMVGVMTVSGGTAALVQRLSRFTRSRERGQLLTSAMGLVVFFDDYANTLLLGGTMRPVTDRLRISREKLAFLIDSTAAPVAGLAVVSTWVGFEVGQIQAGFDAIGAEAGAYTVFLESLPYRFYPLYLLVFVLVIAYLGRDYGSMLKAERRALETGEVSRGGASLHRPGPPSGAVSRRPLARNVLIPLFALLALFVGGLVWTGLRGLEAENARLREAGEGPLAATPANLLSFSDSYDVLLYSSLTASLIAVGCAVVSGALSPLRSGLAWMRGAATMLPALVILLLAWAVAAVCDGQHLQTAAWLVESTRGLISATWMPALAFVLSAVTSFATGSSFATMGLLMPLFISVTFSLLISGGGTFDPANPLLLGTVGAVLAGSLFGDHCSPISDTTVLSSAASGCNHLDHVATQLPYALSVAMISLAVGYVPVGLGVSPWVLLPGGVLLLLLVVKLLGDRPGDATDGRSGQLTVDS